MELLEHIQWQYLCCVPIRDINWKNFFDKPLTWLEQEALLNYTIDNEIITKHNRHVPRSYSLAFFRSIISKLESNNSIDIHDKLYEHYVYLLNDSKFADKNPTNDDHNSFAYRHFKIHDLSKNVGFISIKESQKIISNGTTGLRSWQAAGALADFAITNLEMFQNKCILELGAGTGLAGLIIAKCCQPKRVIMTDGNIDVMKLLELNIGCNFPVKTQTITSEFLDWDTVDDNLVNISTFHKPDLLIAADVVYDPDLFAPLLNVIRYFFEHSENRCRLIMACTERNVETLCQFTEKLEQTFTILYHETIAPKHLYWDNSIPIKIFSCIKKS